MKYPSEVSTTLPAFTAQMYTPQLTETTVAATASSATFRGWVRSCPSQPQFFRTPRMTATATSDQTIRWHRISSAPAGLTSGQYSGNRPQIP